MDAPDFYTLRVGVVEDDLFPRDFADVMWQAFVKDELHSLTLEISQNGDRLRMRILSLQPSKKARHVTR